MSFLITTVIYKFTVSHKKAAFQPPAIVIEMLAQSPTTDTANVQTIFELTNKN